jgi:hypothetical protein
MSNFIERLQNETEVLEQAELVEKSNGSEY